MTNVWNSQTDFSPSELLVLLALADWANDDGFCWPAVPTLARKARMKDRNAQLILKKLEGEGFIEILPHQGPKGANMYHVVVQNLHRCKRPEGVQNPESGGAKTAPEGVQNPAGGGVKTDTQGVHPITPKPSIDTSGEPPEKPSHTRLRAAGASAGTGVCVDKASPPADGDLRGPFPRETYERYARNKPGEIHNPPGWAIAARRSGEFDQMVADWCAEHAIDPRTGETVGSPIDEVLLSAPRPAPAAATINPAACPDCRGVGFVYPEGFEKGVVKCSHPRLTAAA